MPKNISKELEIAILELPQKEKNRLLLRLIAKNDILTEQLQYKLLETEDDLVFRKAEIKDQIEEKLAEHTSYPSQLMWDIKSLNSKITRHRRVTYDKYGEVELTVALLKNVFAQKATFLEILTARTEKLSIYLVKRMIMLLKNIAKLDRDYWIDFKSDIDFILEVMHEKITRIHAREFGLPTEFEI